MKNFIDNKHARPHFIFFFSFYALIIFPMEKMEKYPHFVTRPDIVCFKPHNKYKFSDPKAAFTSHISWEEISPGEIKITPDQKKAIIATIGKVNIFHLGASFEKLERLFDIPQIKGSPLLAIAQKDKELIIVAAGNYTDHHKKKDVSGYRIFKNNQVSEFEPFNFQINPSSEISPPINKILLSETGRFLIVAHHDHAYIKDLDDNSCDRIRCPKENWITDIIMNEKETIILLLTNQGQLSYHNVRRSPANNSVDVALVKTVNTGDIIRHIKFSDSGESMLYVTLHGEVKIIDTFRFLEHSPVDLSRRIINQASDISPATSCQKEESCNSHELTPVTGGNVPSSRFSYLKYYTSVAVNQGSEFITAHWTKHGTPEDCCKIKVYRQTNDTIEKFILIAPLGRGKEYDYITQSGTRETGIGHIISVAIRDNRVLAVCTDGNMYPWMLPDKKDVTEIKKEFIDPNQSDRPVRRRSKTYSGGEKLPPWLDINKISNNLSILPEKTESTEENISLYRESSSSGRKTPTFVKTSKSSRIVEVFKKNSFKRENSGGSISPKTISPINSLSPKAPSSPVNSINKREESEKNEHREIDSPEILQRGRSISRERARVDIWDPEKK